MKSEPPIAHHCHVLADGTVIPDPGYEGPLTVQGPFRGSVSFSWLPARGTEPDTIIAQRRREQATSARAELIGVDYRDITYFFLAAERLNTAFTSGSFFLPTVGGAYPSVINLAPFPATVDPVPIYTDVTYGWPVADSTLDPYYLTNGATLWVEGFDTISPTPGDPGYVDLPGREVLAVGAMRTLAQTIGADDYEWDVYDILVREYKYRNYTWAEWWAI